MSGYDVTVTAGPAKVQTHADVREYPTSGGVTVAASGKELEADIERKVKLWGVIEAFRDGKLPDNTQIENALTYAQSHSPVPLDKLSPEGRTLIDDIRDIIGTMREIVQKKNGDELIQNTLYQSGRVDISHAKQSGVVPTNKADAIADRDEGAKHLRVLTTLFLTNGEVRKLFKDFGVIGRDLFATAATKAADAARPSEQQLQGIDQPAPSNQWHGADGQIHGVDETPTLQMKAADGSEVRYNPKEAPSQAQVIGADGQSRTAGELNQQYQQTKQQAVQQAGQGAQQLAQDARQGQQGGQQSQKTQQMQQQAQHHLGAIDSQRDPNASVGTQARQVRDAAFQHADSDPQARQAQDQARERARGGIQSVRNKIPEEHQQRMTEAWDETRDMFDDAFPEERREQFLWRLRKVLFEVQQHKDYNDAMTWLLDTFAKYRGFAEHVGDKGLHAANEAASDKQASSVVDNFIIILERFANGQSLTPVRRSVDVLYDDAARDPELKQWWHNAGNYINAILLEPGFVMEDAAGEQGTQLKNQGQHFFQGKYKDNWDNVWNNVGEWLKSFHEDPLNRTFGEDWKRLTKDLLFNDEGNFAFKPKLWHDLRTVILPSALRHIGYLPIPRAEYTDEKLDLVVENLILSGPNLFPNIVTLENHNFFKFSPYDSIRDRSHHRFRVGMSQIQADIRDVRFAFKKKKGFPKISDRGIADVVVSRNGITVDVELETVENRTDSVFRVRSVNTTIDELSFSIRDSKHDLLYKFIKGAATGAIKKAIAAAVEGAIRSGLDYLDEQLAEVRNNMDEAKKSDETTRKQALQEMYRRKREEQQKKDAQSDSSKGEFHLVTDRQSQLLPEQVPDEKSSITQRIWKTEDLARSGREWHSPAFSIAPGSDRQHPGVTGRDHPQAVRGAGAGAGISSTVGRNAEQKVASAQQSAQSTGQAATRTADRAAGVDSSRQHDRTGAQSGQHSGLGAGAAGAGAGTAAGLAAGHHAGQHSDRSAGLDRSGVSGQTTTGQHDRTGLTGQTGQHDRSGLTGQTGQHDRSGLTGQTGQHDRTRLSGQTGQHDRTGLSGQTGQHDRTGLTGQHDRTAQTGHSGAGATGAGLASAAGLGSGHTGQPPSGLGHTGQTASGLGHTSGQSGHTGTGLGSHQGQGQSLPQSAAQTVRSEYAQHTGTTGLQSGGAGLGGTGQTTSGLGQTASGLGHTGQGQGLGQSAGLQSGQQQLGQTGQPGQTGGGSIQAAVQSAADQVSGGHTGQGLSGQGARDPRSGV